tara:strand:+ start:1669 stop:2307 length:639 start_codon:yes stop_codon:yes gene_type:complete
MRVHYVQQGTDKWLALRAGCITASSFKSLVTSRGEKTATSTRDTYLNQIIAERLTGKPVDTFKNADMERGNEREGAARELFGAIMEVDVKEVGFHLHDDYDIGCSADGLFSLGSDTGVEIKSPRASTHIKYMRNKKLPTEYMQQVQLSMWLLEVDKYFFFSYHPDLKPLIVEVKRDDEYIEKAVPILIDAAKYVKSETEKLNVQPIFHAYKR